tara:strand:- start:188 stop:529 length:342 start_codon:yes stop_codon:yes gene_type:complete
MGRQLGVIDQALVTISQSTAKTANVGNGEFGAYFISDTDQHTAAGNWSAITFIENTVFATNTALDNWSGNTVIGETFPEGLTIFGDFRVIKLTSGACIAYFKTSNKDVTDSGD